MNQSRAVTPPTFAILGAFCSDPYLGKEGSQGSFKVCCCCCRVVTYLLHCLAPVKLFYKKWAVQLPSLYFNLSSVNFAVHSFERRKGCNKRSAEVGGSRSSVAELHQESPGSPQTFRRWKRQGKVNCCSRLNALCVERLFCSAAKVSYCSFVSKFRLWCWFVKYKKFCRCRSLLWCQKSLANNLTQLLYLLTIT